MPSAGEFQAKARHSVFISYASDDRATVRALRDALEATGLEVWFDENELGGGDAWDQKIRRQIRDCDYFMPVVSAATERRKEGYFRREWRLAVERTMDMADDVLFLAPVVIDDTNEVHARVPDKFLAVQWLRLPGAQPTDALHALAQRMLAGDHRPPPPLPRAGRDAYSLPASTAVPTRKEHHALVMPSFPHPPEKGSGLGHGLKFLAEICWWAINSIWSLVQRLPKWARLVLLVWLLFFLMGRITQMFSSDPAPSRSASRQSAETKRALKKAAEELATLGKPNQKNSADPNPNLNLSDFTKIGERIVRSLAAEGVLARPIAIIPFAADATDGADAAAARAVFNAFYGKMVVARGNAVGLAPGPASDSTDAALLAAAKARGSEFLVHASLGVGADEHFLLVRLFDLETSQPAWTGRFSLSEAEPTTIAEQIAGAVLAAIPKK